MDELDEGKGDGEIHGKNRLYRALVWGNDPEAVGERVEVWAIDLKDAMRKLRETCGQGIDDMTLSVYSPEEADKPR